MQPAIPAHEYSADERAQRARGALIAVLFMAAAAIVVPATALILLLSL